VFSVASLFSQVKLFWVRSGAYPKGELLLGPPLGWAPAFFANIRLDWKDLLVTNNLTYYEHS
jgi:hypothetical protein